MCPNKNRILYTEDHTDTQELVRFILNHLNYEVVITPNFLEALRLAQEETFDLYMLDTSLTDGSGVDLCRRIREFDTATPILFYSGNALDSEKAIAMESGAQAYLTKPATLDELSGAISKLITLAHAAP